MGGAFAGVLTDFVFAAPTAGELLDTPAGNLYVRSGIEQTRGGTPADRQVSILSLANQSSIKSLLAAPRILQRLGDSEWTSIVEVNRNIGRASQNFPNQQFEVKQFQLEDGSTMMALQRGRTVVPLMIGDNPVGYQVLQLPAPQQVTVSASNSANPNTGQELAALYNKAKEQYNAAWKNFRSSDYGTDALNKLEENLTSVQIMSDRSGQGFYTGNDRVRELGVAREAPTLLTQYRTGLTQLNSMDFQNASLLESLPARWRR